jgi:hypothetical protein
VFAYVPFNIANALTVSTVDAKGDLLVGTGADAIGRLAVGTNGQLLSAASGETTGLKWANGGLTLIKTETFSASAAVNVNDVFSATYTNYKIVGQLTLSANNDTLMRLRVSGADNTGGDYSSSGYKIVAGAGAFTVQAATTSFLIYDAAAVALSSNFEMVLYQPFAADQTYGTSFFASGEESGGGTARSMCLSLFHNNNISFDGFTILGNGSNLSGTIKVYGFND